MASSSSTKPTNPQDKETQAAFSAHYLQRATQELAEDLDKVRNADDFKADSVPFLVHALQQGAAQFGPSDQARVVSDLKEEEAGG